MPDEMTQNLKNLRAVERHCRLRAEEIEDGEMPMRPVFSVRRALERLMEAGLLDTVKTTTPDPDTGHRGACPALGKRGSYPCPVCTPDPAQYDELCDELARCLQDFSDIADGDEQNGDSRCWRAYDRAFKVWDRAVGGDMPQRALATPEKP